MADAEKPAIQAAPIRAYCTDHRQAKRSKCEGDDPPCAHGNDDDPSDASAMSHEDENANSPRGADGDRKRKHAADARRSRETEAARNADRLTSTVSNRNDIERVSNADVRVSNADVQVSNARTTSQTSSHGDVAPGVSKTWTTANEANSLRYACKRRHESRLCASRSSKGVRGANKTVTKRYRRDSVYGSKCNGICSANI